MLLRLLLLALLIPALLIVVPFLIASWGGLDGASPPSAASTTASSTLTAAPSAGAATPTSPVRLDATACPTAQAPYPVVAVGPRTSCSFAADTRLAYVNTTAARTSPTATTSPAATPATASGTSAGSGPAAASVAPVQLTVFSVARGENVSLTCEGTSALVTCASTDGAKVYLSTRPLG